MSLNQSVVLLKGRSEEQKPPASRLNVCNPSWLTFTDVKHHIKRLPRRGLPPVTSDRKTNPTWGLNCQGSLQLLGNSKIMRLKTFKELKARLSHLDSFFSSSTFSSEGSSLDCKQSIMHPSLLVSTHKAVIVFVASQPARPCFFCVVVAHYGAARTGLAGLTKKHAAAAAALLCSRRLFV